MGDVTFIVAVNTPKGLASLLVSPHETVEQVIERAAGLAKLDRRDALELAHNGEPLEAGTMMYNFRPGASLDLVATGDVV